MLTWQKIFMLLLFTSQNCELVLSMCTISQYTKINKASSYSRYIFQGTLFCINYDIRNLMEEILNLGYASWVRWVAPYYFCTENWRKAHDEKWDKISRIRTQAERCLCLFIHHSRRVCYICDTFLKALRLPLSWVQIPLWCAALTA